ncbi:MAG: flagellar brake protein [bacterium]|nr:flagellar brake protein [bacterium]
MKIDFVFLLKAIKESENIFIYHKSKNKTLRYFSRFFKLDSGEQAIIIDYPYVDGHSQRQPAKNEPIFVTFNSAGFRFQFDSVIKDEFSFASDQGVRIPALKIAWPDDVLDGNRRSLFRVRLFLDRSIHVKYDILKRFSDMPLPAGPGAFKGIEAIMIDICRDGLAIEINSKRNIEIGDLVKLTFGLDDGNKEKVEIEGIARNVRQLPGSAIHICGIRFAGGKTGTFKQGLKRIACFTMSRNRDNLKFFTVNQIVSQNSYVQRIADNEVTEEVLKMVLAKEMDFSQLDYLESLVYILKIEKFKPLASAQLEMIPFDAKKEYVERPDANHRVAFFILAEALRFSYSKIVACVIKNQYLPVDFLTRIAEKGSGQMLRLLQANRPKLLAYPEIMDIMEDNPAISSSVKKKIRELRASYLQFGRSEDIKEDDVIEEVTAGITRREKEKETAADLKPDMVKEKVLSTLLRINEMSLQERIKLAFSGTRPERMILSRDPNYMVVLAVLESPKLSSEEVLNMVEDKNLHSEVLTGICDSKRWMGNPSILTAALRKPGISPVKAGGLIKMLDLTQLNRLAIDKEINPVIRDMARHEYARKSDGQTETGNTHT